MKKLLLVSALTLAVAFGAFADIVNKASVAEHTPGIAAPANQAGGTGPCTLIYYNFCSGWIWIWSGFGASGRRQLCDRQRQVTITHSPIWSDQCYSSKERRTLRACELWRSC